MSDDVNKQTNENREKWMEGRKSGDVKKGENVYRKSERWNDEKVNRYTGRRQAGVRGGQTDGQTGGQTDRQTDRDTDKRINKQYTTPHYRYSTMNTFQLQQHNEKSHQYQFLESSNVVAHYMVGENISHKSTVPTNTFQAHVLL